MDKKANLLIQKLKAKGLTLALAESMTCGLAAHKLSGCPGTSEVLTGSIVCYTPEVKINLLSVPKKRIEKYTCESQQVTETLAQNLSKIVEADICAAVTGLASTGGSETKNKPVGTVFLSVYTKRKIYNERKLFRGSPLEIRKKACTALYELILRKLEL
ncbi:MAG: hypothetical protein K0S33_449 [Bacteroidetes bacterium]|jgi:PncC family amidohydrolase|nr:hypothetical protein [Bacteroidota bacterium]